MSRSTLVAIVAVVLLASAAEAGVTRLEILRREVVLNGQAFGAAGAYEKLVGRVHFALDPRTPQNQGIVDLALAPRNAQGLVEFSADFYLLKPVDPGRGNGRLFYEAGNRGSKRILPVFQSASDSPRSDQRRRVRQRRADAPGLHAAVDGMAVGRAGRTDADGHPDCHRRRRADHRAGPRQLHPRRQCHRGGHRRPQSPGLPGRRPRRLHRRARPLRAHAAGRRAAGGAAIALALRQRRHHHPRRRLRRRAHLRRRLSRPRSPRGRGRAGRHARPHQLLQARQRRRRQSDARAFASPSAGACRRPAASCATSSTRGSTRTSRAASSSTASSIRWAAPAAARFNHRFGQQSRDQLQHFNIQYPVDMFPFTDEDQTDPITGAPTACSRARGGRTRCRGWCTCSPTPSTSTAPARSSTPT